VHNEEYSVRMQQMAQDVQNLTRDARHSVLCTAPAVHYRKGVLC
jgi:hypothetical protein